MCGSVVGSCSPALAGDTPRLSTPAQEVEPLVAAQADQLFRLVHTAPFPVAVQVRGRILYVYMYAFNSVYTPNPNTTRP